MENQKSSQETALAFLERKVEQLNEALAEQQQEISLLTKRVELLQGQLLNMRDEVADKRPPHY